MLAAATAATFALPATVTAAALVCLFGRRLLPVLAASTAALALPATVAFATTTAALALPATVASATTTASGLLGVCNRSPALSAACSSATTALAFAGFGDRVAIVGRRRNKRPQRLLFDRG